MELRPALTELAEQHKLSCNDIARLHSLAGLHDEPPNLRRIILLGIAILGAGLAGLGIIFGVAANWDKLGRVAQFALLESVVVAMCAGAMWRMSARLPLGVLACLAIGALLAFFGQTYQTGADPWQLFAIWAGLALPLCFGVRHDGLWIIWTLVAMTGVALWSSANNNSNWNIETLNTDVQLLSWAAAILITANFIPRFRAYHGGGEWSLRLSVILSAVMVGSAGLTSLFSHLSSSLTYTLAVLVFIASACLFALPRMHDTFNLCVIGLGLNILLVSGIARQAFKGINDDLLMPLLVTGCAAAALLAGTVMAIFKLSYMHNEGVGA